MLYFLEGQVVEKRENFLILKLNGIGAGVKIFCLEEYLSRIKTCQNLKIFVFLKIKEKETIEIYGFLKEEQLELFEFLNKITGIGPKTAFKLSQAESLENLKNLLEKQDKNFLAKIKIGRKKIQKLLLEISGKIKKFENDKFKTQVNNDVLLALTSLGFSKKQALEALLKVEKNTQIKNTEEKIKASLKLLSKM